MLGFEDLVKILVEVLQRRFLGLLFGFAFVVFFEQFVQSFSRGFLTGSKGLGFDFYIERRVLLPICFCGCLLCSKDLSAGFRFKSEIGVVPLHDALGGIGDCAKGLSATLCLISTLIDEILHVHVISFRYHVIPHTLKHLAADQPFLLSSFATFFHCAVCYHKGVL